MRNLKRVFCLFLAAILCLGMVPALADSPASGKIEASVTDESGGNLNADALSKLSFSLYDEKDEIVSSQSAESGKATFSALKDGTYTVKLNAPANFTPEPATKLAIVQNGGSVSAAFKLATTGSIAISALKADGTGISGVKYRVTDESGKTAGEYTTDANGIAKASGLASGDYTVTQISAPEGYLSGLDTQMVSVKAGSVATVTFENQTESFIVAHAYAEGTSIPVEDCYFVLLDKDGNQVDAGGSVSDGSVMFSGVKPGEYTVKLAYAPSGYSVTESSKTVTVESGKSASVTIYATKNAAVQIKSVKAGDGTPIADSSFRVTDQNGNVIETVSTNPQGYALTSSLTPGSYTITPVPGNGFSESCDGKSVATVSVPEIATINIEFKGTETGGITVYAKDSSGNPMQGMSYHIKHGFTTQEIAKLTTDETGTATKSDLPMGFYIVEEETIPDGYVLMSQRSQVVYVGGDEYDTVMADFVHASQGTIQIQTFDMNTGEPLAGAKYEILDNDNRIVDNPSIDGSGEGLSVRLAPGRYYVKQIEAPEGYLRDTHTETIKLVGDEDPIPVVAQFRNEQMSGIVIEAVSQDDHKPLAGCTFEIYDEGSSEVFHGVTGEDGYLRTDPLEPGRYTIKQVSAPEGYSIVQPILTVEVVTYEPIKKTFENVKLTSLHIELIDADTREPLENGRFKIESIDGTFICEVVTDANGEASVPNLPTGVYMVHESAAPDGYLLNGTYQWAVVTSEGITMLKFTNSKISGLLIQSLTLEGHEPLADTVFEVYTENDKLVGTYTTDSTGTVKVDDLPPGVYLVKEVKGPDGYTIMTPTQKVTITTNEYTTLDFYHTNHSTLTINKKDAVSGGPLAGAEFRITKANGDYVGDYTTNESGQIVIPTLEPGDYIITETKAPEGYMLDSTPRTVTIKDEQPFVLDVTNDSVSGLTIINTTVQDGLPIRGNRFKIETVTGQLVDNYTTDGSGRIHVTLEPGVYVVTQTYVVDGYVLNTEVWNVTIKANVGTTLEVQNEELSSVRIQMVDANTGAGIYGVELEIQDYKNNPVGRFTSDNEGFVYLTGILNEGRYKATLINVPSSYTMDTVPKSFEVDIGETTLIVWKLSGSQGQVHILTYSADDNKMMNIRKNTKIGGAEYQILDAQGNVVITLRSDASGDAYSGALPLGTYYIQQTVAPTGFQLNATKVTLNVTKENDDVKITVYNKSANYSDLTVDAHGPAIAYAGQQVKYFFNNIHGSSTSAMDTFYLHIKIPTDTMRAVTLYTGTWNFSTTYTVEAKTNLRDYFPVASNLNSRSQYSYDLSTISLGLSANEYVTDIRLAFAGIPAAFHETQQVSLLCQVLSTVVNGFQTTLYADVGGYVSGAWYTASSQFNSRIAGGATGSIYPNGTYPSGVYPGGYYYPGVYYPGYYPNGYYPGGTLPDSLPKTGS